MVWHCACVSSVPFSPEAPQTLHQLISKGRVVQPQLIAAHQFGGRAIGKQRQLLFLDPVLHFPAGTVQFFVQRTGGELLGRQGGNYEAGIGPLVQMLRLGYYAPFPLPALACLIGELGEHSGRFLRLCELHLGFVQLTSDDFHQPLVFGQAKHIPHLVVFAPTHDGIAAEATITTQHNLHLRPLRADLGHNPLHLIQRPR